MSLDPSVPAPDSQSSDPSPLSPARMFFYSIGSTGCGAFFSLNNYVLPLYLRAFTHNNVILGLMGSSHSIEGAVIQPFVGTMSDNCRARMGRRRPFMLIFFTLSAVLVACTPTLAHAPASARLWLMITAIFLFTLTFNIALDPYQALMPDITPVAQRGRVTAVWAFFGIAAQAAILPVMGLFHVAYGTIFLLVAMTMIVSNAVTCAATRERPFAGRHTRRTPFADVAYAVGGLQTLKTAAIAMAVFALAGAGLGVVTPFLTLFIKKVTGCTDSQAMTAAFVFLISSMVLVMPFGQLVDRIGAKSTLYVGFTALTIACLLALRVHTLLQVYAVMVLGGLGNAAQSAAAYPMLTEVVPKEEVGVYTGFQTTMLSIAQPLTVSVTGVLINRGTYRLAFLVCGVAIALAMLVLRFVDMRVAEAEISARRARAGVG